MHKTELSDYNIRFDGVVEVPASRVSELLMLGLSPHQFRVFESDAEIKKFNSVSDEKIEIATDESANVNSDWNLPDCYKNLDLTLYFSELLSRLPEDKTGVREIRVGNELLEVKNRGLENMFRTIIYVLDILKEKNIIWGVGRGSSCASFLLFLMGLHLVDPIKYQIPYQEFFH